MGVISRKYKLIFVHIPKNAGTSITKWLTCHDPDCIVTPDYHEPLSYFDKHYPEEFKHYRLFCVVRNTYDRLVSLYRYIKSRSNHPLFKVLQKMTFSDFAQSDHAWHHNQCAYIDRRDLPNLVILRFENLVQELYSFVSELPKDFPHINASKHGHYSLYYTPDLIQKVRETYSAEIDLFHYDFKGTDALHAVITTFKAGTSRD